MLEFRLGDIPEDGQVLFLAAHPDDIEIGCGGTLQLIREQRPELDVRWAVFTSGEVRRQEAIQSARRFLGPAGESHIKMFEFRDGFLPYDAAAVKDVFEDLKREFDPALIFTHYREDRHQDHRLISDLSWNTWRNHLILEYEIPKYDGDLGQPNLFVPLRPEQVEAKLKNVLELFPSQGGKDWFDAETLRGLLRLRGVESRAPERYAEGFYARKLMLNL